MFCSSKKTKQIFISITLNCKKRYALFITSSVHFHLLITFMIHNPPEIFSKNVLPKSKKIRSYRNPATLRFSFYDFPFFSISVSVETTHLKKILICCYQSAAGYLDCYRESTKLLENFWLAWNWIYCCSSFSKNLSDKLGNFQKISARIQDISWI